jgi:hypothetical protein
MSFMVEGVSFSYFPAKLPVSRKPGLPSIVQEILGESNKRLILEAVPEGIQPGRKVRSDGPTRGPCIRSYVFSGKRLCSAERGCALQSNLNVPNRKETGGVIYLKDGKPEVVAHKGKEGQPSVTRSLVVQAPVGFHSHIAEGRRNFNPPTTTDVILYLSIRAQKHDIERLAEIVFTEEGVYVIYGEPSEKALKMKDSEVRTFVEERFRELWPEETTRDLFGVDYARDNKFVPFFHYDENGSGREALNLYMAIFEPLGVYMELVPWGLGETELAEPRS